MNNKKIANIAMIAAIYTAVTLVLAPLSYGAVQVRISEALTMLPLIYAPGIWGVTLGCFLSNLIGAMTGMNPTGYIDAVIGTLATGLAAWGTWKLRNVKPGKFPVLSMLMPVIFNFIFVGTELAVLYMPENLMTGILINGTAVAAGEIIAVILGYVLIRVLDQRTEIFKKI